MCHKFQGAALQHVRAGKCRSKGENRSEDLGAGIAPSPGSVRSRGGSRPSRPDKLFLQLAGEIWIGFLQQRKFALVLFRGKAGKEKKKSFDIKRKKKRQKSNRYNRKTPKLIFLKASAAVAVRARITEPRAYKSARLRVSCPPSFPARTRFS